jgi:hypothetical protein
MRVSRGKLSRIKCAIYQQREEFNFTKVSSNGETGFVTLAGVYGLIQYSNLS